MQGIRFASFAIRSSFGETVSGLGIPIVFPSNDSMTRRPLPSTGSLRVPLLRRYYEALGLLVALGFTSFPSFRCTALSDGDDEISQVPGRPYCARAPLSDPGGVAASEPVRV